jgi:hypothetical protein
MTKPILKQFSDLSVEDFQDHPGWLACQGVDDEESWYSETDEETFRPWTGDLPASASDGMLLVRANFLLRDGSELTGFATPTFEPNDLGAMQPQVFVDHRVIGFWGGMFGIPQEHRVAFYSALGKAAAKVFPIKFEVDPKLADGICSGTIEGFYRIPDGQSLQIEQ